MEILIFARIMLNKKLSFRIPQCPEGLALAVGLSPGKPVEEHEERRGRKASYTRETI
jgi:hypothetical protein